MKRWIPLLAMLALPAAAMACPMCKDSIPSSDAQAAGGGPAGFNITIYLMLGAVFAVLGMVTLTLVRGARSVRR